jgi:cell division protein FtsA
MMLDMPEMEAERVKSTYGNAIWEKDSDQESVSIDLADGQHTKEIKRSEINLVIEARVREIIENVYARLADAGVTKNLGCGMVIAGNGAALRNLREALIDRCKMDVRYASVRRDCIEAGEMIANNPEFTTAAALLLEGTENCAQPVAVETKVEPKVDAFVETVFDPTLEGIRTEEKKQEKEQPTEEKPKEPEIKVEKEKPTTPPKPSKPKREGLFGKWKKTIDNFGGELFNEDDNR